MVGNVYHGVPFPDLSKVSYNANFESLNLRDEAILAFLCHELGHLELGHFTSITSSLRVTPPFLFESENIDDNKTKEYQADEYMFQAFLDGSKVSLVFTLLLNLLAALELASMSRHGKHPLLINRIAHLIYLQNPELNFQNSENLTTDIKEDELLGLAEFAHKLPNEWIYKKACFGK